MTVPTNSGWDVKRKLVWLGSHSFIFRTLFARYMEEQPPREIGNRPNRRLYLSGMHPLVWTGSNRHPGWSPCISEDDRRDLRSWYERHAAFFKILSVNHPMLQAVNVINDQPYQIKIDMKRNPFKPGQLLFGSLVPWRGEWYWSGEQQLLGDASEVDVDDLIRTMKRQSPGIVCRSPRSTRRR